VFVEVFVEVFVGGGQAKFCGIASKATIQSAALVDLATLNDAGGASRAEDGQRTAPMHCGDAHSALKGRHPM